MFSPLQNKQYFIHLQPHDFPLWGSIHHGVHMKQNTNSDS